MPTRLSSFARFVLVLSTASIAVAQTAKVVEPLPAVARAAGYPLTTCVVSGEKLGGMGKPVEYIHRQAGQPDRTVVFCCRGCIKDFLKAPATYLRKLDDAAAKNAKQP